MAPPVENFTQPKSNKERTKWTQHVNRNYDKSKQIIKW